jgi:large subunit ribosomal protein L11
MSKKAAQATSSLVVKLFVNAGQATPGPPIGPALGSKGVKAIDFCKQFNDQSGKIYVPGTRIRAHVTVRPDRTFTFDIRPPSTSDLLKRALGVEKGSSSPGHGDQAGTLSLKHIYEVAKVKKMDPALIPLDMKAVCKMVIHSARSMGFSVVP